MSKRGFTLIELLVVIAIIGILVGIIVPNLGSAKQSSRDTKRIADVKGLQLALGLYYSDKLQYPNTLDDLVTTGYMSAKPKDPQTNGDYIYSPMWQWVSGSTIQTCPAQKSAVLYHLGAKLETNQSLLNEDTEIFKNTPPDPPNEIGTTFQILNLVTYYVCNGATSNFHSNSATCADIVDAGAGNERCFDVTGQ